MLRRSTLVVLTVLAALTFLSTSAFAAVQPDCSDPSVAAIFGPAEGAGGETLPSPVYDPQNKACIYVCSGSEFNTAMKRGTGPSCTDAHNALVTAVSSEASATGSGLCKGAGYLGYCGYTLVVTVSCHWDFVLGTYVEDGYGNLKCKDYC
jgi:hypothetical protein